MRASVKKGGHTPELDRRITQGKPGPSASGFQRPQNRLAELLALFKKGIHLLFTAQTPSLQVVKDDPTDDKFIACAVKLNAAYIVTGDKALQAIREYHGIKILTPREFLKEF